MTFHCIRCGEKIELKHKDDVGICKDCGSGLSFSKGSFSFSYRLDWQTPQEYIEAARSVLGEIELDPATSDNAQARIKAKRYHTGKDNGLIQHWTGKVWINPPYSLLPEMVKKLLNHYLAGDVSEAILLTHTQEIWESWFQAAIKKSSAFCLFNHLVKWHAGHAAEIPKIMLFLGTAPKYDTRGSIAVYFGPNPDRFEQYFGKYGVISICQKKRKPLLKHRSEQLMQ